MDTEEFIRYNLYHVKYSILIFIYHLDVLLLVHSMVSNVLPRTGFLMLPNVQRRICTISLFEE